MTLTDAIRDDLDKLVDQAMWAHGYGYAKAGRGLDAEHGADLSRPEQERAAGPVFDLEVGDHKARVAYQHAIVAVSRADVWLAAALAASGTGFQPPARVLTVYERPDALRRAARRVTWRLHQLDEGANRKLLDTIRASFDRAVRDLSKALDHGSTDGIAHGEAMCRTCAIRPSADRKTECDTCATWRRRNGAPRPIKLDADAVNQARAAQARRLARGEGWGEG